MPLKPYNLTLSNKWPKSFIIHHTHEFSEEIKGFDHDMSTPQSMRMNSINYLKTRMPNLPYNFIVEQIFNDYSVLNFQPLFTECEFLDIPKKRRKDIHIGILGNTGMDIPPTRLYEVIAYRIIAPYMRVFRIPINNIFLHSEISYDKDLPKCPGEFFKKSKLMLAVRNQIRRQAITVG